MKFKRKVVAVFTVLTLIAMSTPQLNLNAKAAETTLADIVKDCGLSYVLVDSSTQSIRSAPGVHYVSTNSNEAIDHGAPKEVYVTLSGCFVDARITGIFTTKGEYIVDWQGYCLKYKLF